MLNIKKKPIYFYFFIITIILTCYCFLSCHRIKDIQTVKIGYIPVSTNLPLYVAIENDYFGEYGLKTELIKFETSNQQLDALLAGKIDVTGVNADLPLFSVAQQMPDAFRIYMIEVLTPDRPFDRIISKKGSNIKNIRDLEGKKIGTFPGSQLKYYTELIVQDFFNPKNITIIEIPPQNQIPALIGGLVDAIFTLEPIGTVTLEKGIGQVVEDSPISKNLGESKPFPAASFVISVRFIESKPDSATKFIKALYKALDDIRKDENKWTFLYPKFTPIDKELSPKIVLTQFWKSNEVDLNAFQKEANISYYAGFLNRRVDVKQLIYLLPE